MNIDKRFTVLLCMVFIIMGICGYQLFLSFNTYAATEEKLNEINVEQYHINQIEKVLEAVNDVNEVKSSTSSSDKYDRMNIFYDNGFKVKDSKITLSLKGKTVSFELGGTHSVNIDTSKSSLLLDDSIVVELSDKVSDLPDETCVVTNNEENLVVIGKLNVDTNLSMTMYYPTDAEKVEEDTQKTQAMLKSAKIEKSMPLVCFEEIDMSDKYNNLIMENSSMQIVVDENPVYFYNFESEYTGAGFSEVTFEKAKLLFSEIKDSESGYSPYLLKTENSTFEILAKSEEDIKALFD